MAELKPSLATAATGDGTTMAAASATHALPLSVLAELTHRCPLQCSYCSNPVELERAANELTTAEWLRVIDQLADLGVLQIHFSGGEPTARNDLVDLVRHADRVGLYVNLITSAVLLDRAKVESLAEAGLAHVQISIQGARPAAADRIAGLRGAHARKLAVAGFVRDTGMSLTINAVVHRQNLEELPEIIALAVDLGAARLEVAHVQYYGWALRNRAALIPTIGQLDSATRVVEEARDRLRGVLAIDYVIPDYYALRPKKCMGGWGQAFFTLSPSGKLLPCHAAESITTLSFESVKDHPIAWIWEHSDAIRRYRGTGWMLEPCRSCSFKEEDWGGCRCQAFAFTGDAANTDPACSLSPFHAGMFRLARSEAAADARRLIYRDFAGGRLEESAQAGNGDQAAGQR